MTTDLWLKQYRRGRYMTLVARKSSQRLRQLYPVDLVESFAHRAEKSMKKRETRDHDPRLDDGCALTLASLLSIPRNPFCCLWWLHAQVAEMHGRPVVCSHCMPSFIMTQVLLDGSQILFEGLTKSIPQPASNALSKFAHPGANGYDQHPRNPWLLVYPTIITIYRLPERQNLVRAPEQRQLEHPRTPVSRCPKGVLVRRATSTA